MRCLACDFGGSSLKYALVDENATLIDSGKLAAPLESKEQFIETVGSLYDKFLGEIEGIAISIPGYVNPDTGYLFGSGVYRALYENCITELLKQRCPVNIAVENDGKCGALSEAWKGSLADCSDGAVIILGSGVAGGIIKDRRIHRGKGFAAGEFSYLITKPGDYGFMGCSFMSAGMLGMTYKMCKAKNLDFSVQDSSSSLEMFDTMLHSRYAEPTQELQKIKADGKQMFKWLAQGDKDVEGIYYEFISSLAVLVHNIQICFAPEKIVIGGGLSMQDKIFDDLRAELSRYYEPMGMHKQLQAEIVKSKYLDECNLVGAMYNYLTHFA